MNPSSIVAPLALELTRFATAHPDLAEMVVKVITSAVERAMRLGPTKPAVWFRAFESAARQFANRKFAAEWTKAVATRFPARRPDDTISEKVRKAR